MQTSTKKEVSCKALEPLFNALKNKNLNEELLLKNIPYDISYLKDYHERIEWSVWCKIISNINPFFSQSEFQEMGANVIKSGSYIIGMLFAFFLFTTNKIAKLLNKQAFKLVGSTMEEPLGRVKQAEQQTHLVTFTSVMPLKVGQLVKMALSSTQLTAALHLLKKDKLMKCRQHIP